MVKKNKFYGVPLDALDLPTRWSSETPLFNQKDSIVLMDYCEKNNYGVLGIEGFNIEKNLIIPNINAIVDFSELMKSDSSEFNKKSVEIAKNFLSDYLGSNIEFEFLLVCPG